jgi:translation initiation factor IF-2
LEEKQFRALQLRRKHLPWRPLPDRKALPVSLAVGNFRAAPARTKANSVAGPSAARGPQPPAQPARPRPSPPSRPQAPQPRPGRKALAPAQRGPAQAQPQGPQPTARRGSVATAQPQGPQPRASARPATSAQRKVRRPGPTASSSRRPRSSPARFLDPQGSVKIAAASRTESVATGYPRAGLQNAKTCGPPRNTLSRSSGRNRGSPASTGWHG